MQYRNLIVVCTCYWFSVFVTKEQSSQLLRRFPRRNKGVFEEVHQGNQERECFEETCNYEEAFEVSDMKTVAVGLQYSKRCQCYLLQNLEYKLCLIWDIQPYLWPSKTSERNECFMGLMLMKPYNHVTM